MPQIYWDSIVEDGIIYRKRSDNTLILTGTKEPIEDIVIPEHVQGFAVTSIADNAFRMNNHLHSIKLPAFLTYVGKSAFAYCQKLENVHFKADIVSFDRGAFCGCGKLQCVSGWSFEALDFSTFEGCSRLEVIDAYFVGDIQQNTFLRCKRLKSLSFDDRINIHKNTFIGCMSLERMFFESNVTLDNDAISFVAKRTIYCNSDCWLVDLSYTGTNVIIRT